MRGEPDRQTANTRGSGGSGGEGARRERERWREGGREEEEDVRRESER